MTAAAQKTGISEILMLMVIPAATLHAVCVTFALPPAFLFKLYIAAVLLFFSARDIMAHAGSVPVKLRGWASSLSAAEIIAFAAGFIALFNAVVVNRHLGSASFQEAGGFLLAIAGIGSFFRRLADGHRFIIRMLWVVAGLSIAQCAVSVIHCRHEVLAAVSGPVTAADYIRTSWKASFCYTNPNSFGFYMMAGGTAAWALSLYYLFRGRAFPAAAALVSTGLCALGILLSASRASMFGFAAAVLVCVCFPSVVKRGLSAIRRRPLWAAVFLCILVLGGTFLFRNYIDIFTRKFDNGTIYRSAFWNQLFEDPSRHGAIDVVTANRYSFWKGFLAQQVQSFPSFDFFFGRGNYRPINPVEPGMELHNVYLELWGKYGIFCSVGLIAFLMLCMRKVFIRKEFLFLAGVCLSFILHGFFEDKIFVNSLHPQLLYLYTVLLFPLCGGTRDTQVQP